MLAGSPMSWLAASLQNHPRDCPFSRPWARASRCPASYWVFQAECCCLRASGWMAVGQLGIKPPPALQWSFFVLFLFAVGYKTGPQFFEGLGRSALPQIGLSLLFCAVSLASAYFISKLFGFNAGG